MHIHHIYTCVRCIAHTVICAFYDICNVIYTYILGVYCEATEVVITDFESIIKCLKKGINKRAVECTAMNDTSSRSHTIFK